MFAAARAKLRALGEVIDEHMKGEGFVFERGTRDALEALHGTVQELDNRLHRLEVQSGIKGEDERPANIQAELDEAEAGCGKQGHEEGHSEGEHGGPGEHG